MNHLSKVFIDVPFPFKTKNPTSSTRASFQSIGRFAFVVLEESLLGSWPGRWIEGSQSEAGKEAAESFPPGGNAKHWREATIIVIGGNEAEAPAPDLLNITQYRGRHTQKTSSPAQPCLSCSLPAARSRLPHCCS